MLLIHRRFFLSNKFNLINLSFFLDLYTNVGLSINSSRNNQYFRSKQTHFTEEIQVTQVWIVIRKTNSLAMYPPTCWSFNPWNNTKWKKNQLFRLIAELLCGRRPQKWSPILILRGMLVIVYGHGKRNGSRARAPYIHTYVTELNNALRMFVTSLLSSSRPQSCDPYGQRHGSQL